MPRLLLYSRYSPPHQPAVQHLHQTVRAILNGRLFLPLLTTMKHEDIRWNRINGEWFCAKCGRTSERMVKDDAQAELEKYECNLPAVNPTQVDRK